MSTMSPSAILKALRPKKDQDDVEAAMVDSFVRGRKQYNEGGRLVNAAKKYFEASAKTMWQGASAVVIAENKTRAGFDMDAFKKDHPDLYDKYYRIDLPSVGFSVIEGVALAPAKAAKKKKAG